MSSNGTTEGDDVTSTEHTEGNEVMDQGEIPDTGMNTGHDFCYGHGGRQGSRRSPDSHVVFWLSLILTA